MRTTNGNEALIIQNFSPQDVEDIINTPLGDKSVKDEIIWQTNKKGSFTVKSAYHLAVSISNLKDASPSDQSRSSHLWKSLWAADVIPRAKISAWKLINNITPYKANILSKGIDLNPFCTLCKKKEEATPHIIWYCKISKEMWVNLIPNISPIFFMCRKSWNSMVYWEWMVDNLTKEELPKGIIIM